MSTFTRFAPLFLAALTFAACSSSSGSPVTMTEHDAGVDAKVTHHPDAGTKDAKTADVTPGPDVFVPNRAPGQRTPLTANCDPVDPTRCLLPWPSNTFTKVDSASATGLILSVGPMGLGATDDATSINRSDGFSRVSPIITGFQGTLDATTLGNLTTGSVRLIVEQPGATFGQLVPLRFDTVANDGAPTQQSILIAYPRVPLAPATDYAVVVMNSAKTTDGNPLTADRNGEVALGLSAPETSYEGALYAYDAPARAAMKMAGIDPKDAVRVWDFTTRSLAQPTNDILTMRNSEIAAFDGSSVADGGLFADGGGIVDAGPWDAGPMTAGPGIGIAIDSVTTTVTGTVLMAVTGRILGVPSYLGVSGSLNRDATGAPVAMGVHEVPFRAAIPVGTGDYHIVMYGHGTGGTYDESSFDQEITSGGAVKVGTQFIGWTATSVIDTFTLFTQAIVACDIAASGLAQSTADTMLVQHALEGSLGTLLAAPTIGGVVNPAAGRHPNPALPVWAGGSLGGTMGFVYTAAEPSITAGVLNVPGAAWTQFVVYSTLFSVVRSIMEAHYPTPMDVELAVAMGQTDFDVVDGAVWQDAVGDHHPVLLEQMSMGDPVLPNIGNEMVASASQAVQIGVVLDPIPTCMNVPSATNQSGMTQFKVPKTVTAPLDIHGFAAGSSPAGVAAQEQIVSFITSVWAGTPSITVPPECVMNTPMNSCDFTND